MKQGSKQLTFKIIRLLNTAVEIFQQC